MKSAIIAVILFLQLIAHIVDADARIRGAQDGDNRILDGQWDGAERYQGYPVKGMGTYDRQEKKKKKEKSEKKKSMKNKLKNYSKSSKHSHYMSSDEVSISDFSSLSSGSKKGKGSKKNKKHKKGKKDKLGQAGLAFGSRSVIQPRPGTNECEGKNPSLPNIKCVVDQILLVGPQSGINVTEGYVGGYETWNQPLTQPFFMAGLCPVNVHWHLGAEHYSVGEYDETGNGPSEVGDTRLGFQCTHYDAGDPKFTTPYNWQHCVDMEVGQTYEVQWTHSAAGACGTVNQYQTPYYDGIFCRDGVLTDTTTQIGVQAQVFIVVNDDSYFYPDLMRGMIVDGEYGYDIGAYTGSTTGDSRDNEVCSQYAPITWHVDRQCHLLSASAFDRLCENMLSQRDNMSDDLSPHGARELVADHLAADNLQR